jgi:Xaa-Pro aminopeptidase
VHEGPQGISFNFANHQPLLPGMVLSNEPGFYLPGEFGIRIENLLIVVEKGQVRTMMMMNDGNGFEQRAGLLPPRRVRHPHREPPHRGGEGTGGDDK